jgi:hypothetical protein
VSRARTIRQRFVTEVPRELEEATIYISVDYATCIHRCCCGCGAEVVTPLSPQQWTLTFDGDTVSLWPSIGSWALPCQSHYIIRRNRVRWARHWTAQEIEKGRERDRRAISLSRGGGDLPEPGGVSKSPSKSPRRRLITR